MWFQLSNAYHIFSPSYWFGYQPPETPPAPHPSTWGATPPLPSVLERACEAMRDRLPFGSPLFAILEEDPRDEIAVGLARLGRMIYNKAKP
jgi:hypothetical protein